MNGEEVAIIISVTAFISIFLSIYFFIQARNKERMALIEAGQDLSQFYNKKKSNISYWLRIGIFAVGLGLGFLIIGLVKINGLYINGQLKTAVLVLCGGIAMIAANYIDKPKSEKD